MGDEIKSRTFGRLRYFDPNTSVYENKQGTHSDSINFPYEDYNIAVDLQIQSYNRYSCGIGNTTDGSNNLTFSTSDGTISFLGGTNGVLTTNYTDIQMVNPSGNTQECLGIESIQVSYDSWLHPTVNVVFIDVRGGTIMQPADYNYYNSNNGEPNGPSYQLYKSLFTFPYPLFLLKVKGFYGRGVTYRLAVNKTDIDFDASSGNFKISVDFIGHIYGLFADIPMTYIAIAPYMEDGDKYWNEKINDSKKTFWFYRMADNGELIAEAPMLKFPGLVLKIAEVVYSQPSIEMDVEMEATMQSIDSEVASLTTISDSYRMLFKTNESVIYVKGPDNYSYFICADTTFSSEDGQLKSFLTQLENHDKTYHTNYKEQFGKLETIGNYVSFSKTKTDGIFVRDKDRGLKFFDYISEVINNDEKERVNSFNRQQIYAYWYEDGGKDYDKIISSINESCKKIQDSKSVKKEEMLEKKNAYIEQALGFKPSIKNMYDLIFAHLDTFMYLYYECLKKIKRQLDSKDDVRKKVTYSIRDEFTDTPLSSGGGSKMGDFLPPYTSFYDDKSPSENNSNTNKKVLSWPPDVSPLLERGLSEVDFVYELLAASKLYFETTGEINKKIEELKSSSGNNNTFVNNGPSIDVNGFIPLTVYDIANNGTIPNPYLDISAKIKNNTDSNEVIGDLYEIFALRLFYYMNSFDNTGNNINDSEALYFGRLEAINFFKAVGKNNSKVLHEILEKLAIGGLYNRVGDAYDFTTAICYNGDINDVKKKCVLSWRVDGSETTNRNLFETNGGWLKYNLSKSAKVTVDGKDVYFKYFPLQITSSNGIKNTFSNGYPFYKNGYISSISFGEYSGTTNNFSTGRTMDGGTFLLYESRDYIKNLYENVRNDLNREASEDYDALTDQEFYKAYRSNSTFKGYSNNIDSDFKSVVKKKCLQKINGEVEKSGKETIEIGSDADREGYFIAFPDMIDEGSTKNQYGQNRSTILVSDAKCVLETPLYWMQNNDYARAMFFIQGTLLGDTSSFWDWERTGIFGIIYKNNAVIQRASLLREGSTYWWHDNTDKVITSGTCNFNLSLGEKGEKNIVNGISSYKRPTENELFISNNKQWGFLENYSSEVTDTFETFNPIPDWDNNAEYYKIPYYGGKNKHYAKDVTKSRVAYLKKYFETWVENEFSPIRELYENLNLYAADKKGVRMYRNGLDKSYLEGTYFSSESSLVGDARKLQEFLKGVYFKACTVFDYYNGFYDKEEMKVREDYMRNGLYGFMEQFKNIYGTMAETSQVDIDYAFAKIHAADPFRNNDLRLSTYMTLKSLYDKWICNSLKGEKTWRFDRTDVGDKEYYDKSGVKRDESHRKEKGCYELDNFIYVDNFYRDIGYDLTINLTKYIDWVSKCLPTSQINTVEGIMSYNSKTLYEFLTDIAQDCGAILLAVPQRFMYDNGDNIKTVFTPIPSCDDWDDDTYTYMFLYTYKPSEHLGDEDTSGMDMNGWSPNGDGYSLTDKDIVGELFSDNERGFSVPAFGVTFAKGNQSYFKNISLSTKQHGVTEVGLSATFQIPSKGSEAIRETSLYGQDIYKVFSNNSYDCTVEMMGDMQIFPPMYFQLNNIPMWKGAYLIKKVIHNIKPGDVTTTLVGTRQNKYLIPMVNGTIASLNSHGGGNSDNQTNFEASNLKIEETTGSGVGVVNEPANRGKMISEDKDLDANNITPQKPIICITPAHYYGGEKALEHAWSTRLVDNYIIPKLKTQRFRDGTSYEKNVFRGGRTDKPDRRSSKYDLWPVRHLISKYGSDCVISVVPHWNGNGGKYFSVFYGKAEDCEQYQVVENGKLKYDSNGKPVMWWRNCKKLYYREDSRKFGMYMRAAANEVVSKSESYSKMPIGMMSGGVKGEENAFSYLLTPVNTDPGPMLNCSCVLTENFFANYYPTEKNRLNWKSENYNALDSNGRYQNGRAWLESEEGMEVIANMHVNAIVNYINSLS